MADQPPAPVVSAPPASGFMPRWGLLVAAVGLSIPVLMVTRAIVRRPEEFARRWLRTGGRLIKEATENVPRVAALLALAVVICWIAVGVAMVIQRRRKATK